MDSAEAIRCGFEMLSINEHIGVYLASTIGLMHSRSMLNL